MRCRLLILGLVAVAAASPHPQGVTKAIAPSAPAPTGCNIAYPGSFGIAVLNVSTAMVDGFIGIKSQVAAPTSSLPQAAAAAAQAPAPSKMFVVTQIGDGQIQAPVSGVMRPAEPTTTTRITSTVTKYVTVSPSRSVTASPSVGVRSASAAKADGLVSLTQTVEVVAGPIGGSGSIAGQLVRREPQTPAGSAAPAASSSPMVACKTNGTLAMTLNNGILKDARGWTAYIADNYQFQFDDPPQAGSIYTAGWSVCGNGSLALGGSAIFWQCRSGDFYNLYDRYWAPQCNPITINAVELKTC